MIKNNYILFSVLCVVIFLLSEISKYFLNTNQLLYNSLAENFSYQQIEELFRIQRKWQLWGYLLLPVLICIKTQVIAAVLSMGAFFFEKDIKHKQLWGIVLRAEFIFLMIGVIKIIWFSSFQQDYSLEELHTFYPLSMLSVVGFKNIAPWFMYPLQIVNVFEIIYCIILSLLIDRTLRENDQHSGFKIVACSYCPAMLIWVGAVMFMSLNMN